MAARPRKRQRNHPPDYSSDEEQSQQIIQQNLLVRSVRRVRGVRRANSKLTPQKYTYTTVTFFLYFLAIRIVFGGFFSIGNFKISHKNSGSEKCLKIRPCLGDPHGSTRRILFSQFFF